MLLPPPDRPDERANRFRRDLERQASQYFRVRSHHVVELDVLEAQLPVHVPINRLAVVGRDVRQAVYE